MATFSGVRLKITFACILALLLSPKIHAGKGERRSPQLVKQIHSLSQKNKELADELAFFTYYSPEQRKRAEFTAQVQRDRLQTAQLELENTKAQSASQIEVQKQRRLTEEALTNEIKVSLHFTFSLAN